MTDYLQRCEPTRQHTQCAGCARRASNAGREAIDASGVISAKMGCPMYESTQLQNLLKMAPTAHRLERLRLCAACHGNRLFPSGCRVCNGMGQVFG